MIHRVFFADDSERGFWTIWGPDWVERWGRAWARLSADAQELETFNALKMESRAELLRAAQEDPRAGGVALITDANFGFEYSRPELGGARLAKEFVAAARGARAVVYSVEPRGFGDEGENIWLFTARLDAAGRGAEIDALVEFLNSGRRLDIKALRALLEEVVAVSAGLARAVGKLALDPASDVFGLCGILKSIKSATDGVGEGSRTCLFEPQTQELFGNRLEKVLPPTVLDAERLAFLKGSLDPCESLKSGIKWAKNFQMQPAVDQATDQGALRLLWELVRSEGSLVRICLPTESERDEQLLPRLRGVLLACREELASTEIVPTDLTLARALLASASREAAAVVEVVKRWRDFDSRAARRAALSHSAVPDLLQRLGATDEFFSEERGPERREDQLRKALLRIDNPPNLNVLVACKAWCECPGAEGIRNRLRSVVADIIHSDEPAGLTLAILDSWLLTLDEILVPASIMDFARSPEPAKTEVAISFSNAARELFDILRDLGRTSA